MINHRELPPHVYPMPEPLPDFAVGDQPAPQDLYPSASDLRATVPESVCGDVDEEDVEAYAGRPQAAEAIGPLAGNAALELVDETDIPSHAQLIEQPKPAGDALEPAPEIIEPQENNEPAAEAPEPPENVVAGSPPDVPPIEPPEIPTPGPEEPEEPEKPHDIEQTGLPAETDSAAEPHSSPRERTGNLDWQTTPTQHLMFSTSHAQPAIVAAAADALADGIPESWPPAEVEGTSAAFRVDDAEHPRLFLKSRGDAATQQALLREVLEQAANSDDSGESADLDASKVANVRGQLDVASEMKLAPLVTDIVSSQVVQDIAQENGFVSVSYVAPLVAGIDRQTGETYTVYPWVEGTKPVDDWGDIEDPERSQEEQHAIDALEAVTVGIRQNLLNNGIIPIDFSPGDFMVTQDASGGQHLHVIDASRFVARDGA